MFGFGPWMMDDDGMFMVEYGGCLYGFIWWNGMSDQIILSGFPKRVKV